MTQRVVSIVGPTASGKTGLGIAIARRLAEAGERAEIVNADAYQMYRGMDIGTAKPTAEEQAAVPHHLIDIIDPEDTMSVARFQQLARETIADLQSRGIRPILVGGSGLYARAAIDDITFPGTDPDVRTRLEEREKTEGAGVRRVAGQRPRGRRAHGPTQSTPHHPCAGGHRAYRQTVFGQSAALPVRDSVRADRTRPGPPGFGPSHRFAHQADV